MPTEISARPAPQAYRRGRSLTWPQTVRFFWLFAGVMVLDVRLQRAHRRVDRLGLNVAGDELLRLARRWLACHEAIGALLMAEEPAAVAELRSALRAPRQP